MSLIYEIKKRKIESGWMKKQIRYLYDLTFGYEYKSVKHLHYYEGIPEKDIKALIKMINEKINLQS